MARKFHRKDRLSALTEINVTPLIDLAFALLIIFMITTPLLEQTVEINLPIESVKPQPESREDFQRVLVDKNGDFYWGDSPVSAEELGAFLDIMATDPDPPVISLRGDASVPYQKVMTVIDMIKQRKLTKLSLDTKAE